MIKGVIFDYGGTLDSRGVHWSEVLWQGWQQAGVPVNKDMFRIAYVEGERALARERVILPQDNFLELLRKKVPIELAAVPVETLGDPSPGRLREWAESVAAYCYGAARACIEEARPVLQALSERFPLMVVSNFYGNIDEVLRDFGIRHFFKGIIESSVVGIRKPNPTLFRLGVDALELPAEQVLVVGDSLRKDIEPAERLGCQVMWLKGKGWTADEDALTHPRQIDRISQVLDILQ